MAFDTSNIENRLFINGEFVPSASGRKFQLVNPITKAVTVDVFEAGVDDVDRAVASARDAFPHWSETDASERRSLMLKLADLIDASKDELAELEALSMGKPVATYPDQWLATGVLRYYAGKAFDIHGVTSLNSQNHLNFSLRQPYGVTAAIIPWNAPLLMLALKVGAALIAGNTLVLKSSEKAPLTALVFARLSREAGFPAGVLNILSGLGNPCGSALASHQDIRKISFTGSLRTGRLIQKAAAESNLKACTLELGGKGPLIVFEDADLQKAATAAAFSIVFNSGQMCMASSRVYVHKNVAERFLEMYKAAIQQVAGKVGNPLDTTVTFGPQADKQQYEQLVKYLEGASGEPLEFLMGGVPPSAGQGYFVPPTVIYNAPEDSAVMKNELFGTVACVNSFTDEAEVVSRANNTIYGLYASVFTNDLNRSIRMAKYLEAGTVAVNTSSPYYCHDLPFGGYKSSGTGRELGQEGLEAWLEVKSIYVKL
ncbi:hypothetical protein DTO027B5_4674 [Paecilomyces variotii]|nr:hypothetical protein DTO027B3_2088 [Paecilomyces variotii]KAJ9333490.1 hypothetical protein DTO027B5_4674 [Paecilomyces variotii]